MSQPDYNAIKLKINTILDEIIQLRQQYEKENDPVKRMDIIAQIYNKRLEIDQLLNSLVP